MQSALPHTKPDLLTVRCGVFVLQDITLTKERPPEKVGRRAVVGFTHLRPGRFPYFFLAEWMQVRVSVPNEQRPHRLRRLGSDASRFATRSEEIKRFRLPISGVRTP